MTVSEEHEFFMNEAVKEAQIGIRARHGGPFGCVVVKNGQIVGRGHNQVIGRDPEDGTGAGSGDHSRHPVKFQRQSRARCV